MKDQINTIREALTKRDDASAWHKGLLALTQLEAAVGSVEPVAKVVLTEKLGLPCLQWLDLTRQFDFKGGEFLYTTQPAQQPQAEPHKPLFADLIDKHQGLREELSEMGKQPQAEAVPQGGWKHDCAALLQNDVELWVERCPHCGKPAQPQYEAGDMASAFAQGFRDGQAAQQAQPSEIEVTCPVCNHTFYEWPEQAQADAVPVVDRVYEAAKRLVDHADFQLGGVLSAKSKARDIPSNAASKVKARHLASLRDALAKTPYQAEAVQYTRADLDRAYSAGLVEGERLAIQQAEAGPTGFKHACYLWVDPETNKYEVDHFEHHLSELTPAYIKVAAIAQQKGQT